MVCRVVPVLSTSVSAPSRMALLFGLNLTVTVHEAFAAKVVFEHVSACLVNLVPVTVLVPNVTELVPVLVTTVTASFTELTGLLPKFTVVAPKMFVMVTPLVVPEPRANENWNPLPVNCTGEPVA